MEKLIKNILSNAVTNDYAEKILTEDIMQLVIEDIEDCSDFKITGNYNDDDIRLALGRVLNAQLRKEKNLYDYIKSLSNNTRQELLHLLWNIEDELSYENKSITEMIDYIQTNY